MGGGVSQQVTSLIDDPSFGGPMLYSLELQVIRRALSDRLMKKPMKIKKKYR